MSEKDLRNLRKLNRDYSSLEKPLIALKIGAIGALAFPVIDILQYQITGKSIVEHLNASVSPIQTYLTDGLIFLSGMGSGVAYKYYRKLIEIDKERIIIENTKPRPEPYGLN
jgi:hypothetical protein